MEDRKTDLPSGWFITTIGEISDVNKRNPALRDYPDEMSVTFVPMAAVDAAKGVIANPQIRRLGEVRKGFTAFSNDDVIIAKITPSMENGKAAIAKDLLNGIGFGSTEFHVMSPKSDVLPPYLFYFVRQETFRCDAKANFAGTAGQLRVPGRFIEKYPIPLPPLPEQERIVERIESLFTQLDAGVAGLKRLKEALNRYKASVLKAACEGKLVPQDPSEEPAEEVLERILAEKGKVYQRPSSDLPRLPIGWVWAQWEQLVLLSQNGFGKRKTNFNKHTIVLRLADVVGDQISLDNVRRIGAADDEIKKYELQKNDIICIRVNGSLNNVGRMILFSNYSEPVLFCDHFIRFRLVQPQMASYLTKYFDTDRARKFIELNRVSSAGQNTISQGTLLNFMVPLPPMHEQLRIVADLDLRLSVVQDLEQAIEANLKRVARLRQAILKRAFEGRLVSQHLHDVPVPAVLIAPISDKTETTFKQEILF